MRTCYFGAIIQLPTVLEGWGGKEGSKVQVETVSWEERRERMLGEAGAGAWDE